MPTNRVTTKRLLQAIEGSGGVITIIAQRLDCTWHTAEKWIRGDPVALQAWQDERDRVVDLAETVIINKLREGDAGTARWVLGTLGRNRGWVERRELTGADGGAIKVEGLTDTQRIEQIMAILEAARERADREASE